MQTELIKLTQNTKIDVTEDTQFVISFPQSSLSSSPISLTLNLTRPGVSTEIIGLYKITKNEVLNLTTIAHHQAPNTSCETNIKGVLYDQAQSNYVGKILIDKPAQQTNSFLHDAILMLGDNVKNHAEPILEIEANDVRASHGSTSGRIDESQIYYLESRGLSEEEATNIITDGFFENLLAKIHNRSVADKIKIMIHNS